MSAALAFVREASAAPPVPQSLEEAGLASGILEQLISKVLFLRNTCTGRDLARHLGLPFSLIDPVLEFFKRHHLAEIQRSLGMGNLSSVFVLSEAGRKHAAQCLDSNRYAGPAPVPLAQYAAVVRRQRLKQGWLSRRQLEKAYENIVVGPHLLTQLGPAVNSGKSFLIYGQPGNGKTYLAQALSRLEQPEIWLPYAIEFQGSIVQLFDPLYHERLDTGEESPLAFTFDEDADRRWIRSKRPFIVSGGELTLPMLDLSLDPSTKVYNAPLHLKANNGIYLIDDFGRQKVTPAELLNRWIVPMENRIDYLGLANGAKMEIPFECFLVFSTNLKPGQLGDEAFLRRIQYKLLVGNPTRAEFSEIFDRLCLENGLECLPETRNNFIDAHYGDFPMRRCHPRDILCHAMDLIRFENLPDVLTEEVLEAAFEGCFVDESALES